MYQRTVFCASKRHTNCEKHSRYLQRIDTIIRKINVKSHKPLRSEELRNKGLVSRVRALLKRKAIVDQRSQ